MPATKDIAESGQPESMSRSLSFIKYGSVIDHIQDRHALKLVDLLNLDTYDNRVSIGLHLPSPTMGFKDMIKIEGWQLNPEEANRVAVLSPDATISLVNQYEVEKKFNVSLPDTIHSVLTCPNPHCITNHEQCTTAFAVRQLRTKVLLQCHHCRGLYSQNEIKRFNT